MNLQTKRVAKAASDSGTMLQVGTFYFASKSIFAGTVLPPRIMGQAAGTKAAQGILKSMSEYQKRYINPEIIQHLERAFEGKESLDLNRVIEELGPMMTQKEIDAMKSGQTGQYYELHVPKGWTPPTEEQQKQEIQKDDAANQKSS